MRWRFSQSLDRKVGDQGGAERGINRLGPETASSYSWGSKTQPKGCDIPGR